MCRTDTQLPFFYRGYSISQRPPVPPASPSPSEATGAAPHPSPSPRVPAPLPPRRCRRRVWPGVARAAPRSPAVAALLLPPSLDPGSGERSWRRSPSAGGVPARIWTAAVRRRCSLAAVTAHGLRRPAAPGWPRSRPYGPDLGRGGPAGGRSGLFSGGFRRAPRDRDGGCCAATAAARRRSFTGPRRAWPDRGSGVPLLLCPVCYRLSRWRLFPPSWLRCCRSLSSGVSFGSGRPRFVGRGETTAVSS